MLHASTQMPGMTPPLHLTYSYITRLKP